MSPDIPYLDTSDISSCGYAATLKYMYMYMYFEVQNLWDRSTSGKLFLFILPKVNLDLSIRISGYSVSTRPRVIWLIVNLRVPVDLNLVFNQYYCSTSLYRADTPAGAVNFLRTWTK